MLGTTHETKNLRSLVFISLRDIRMLDLNLFCVAAHIVLRNLRQLTIKEMSDYIFIKFERLKKRKANIRHITTTPNIRNCGFVV